MDVQYYIASCTYKNFNMSSSNIFDCKARIVIDVCGQLRVSHRDTLETKWSISSCTTV